MKNKLLKFFRNFAIFLMIVGILFSNIPFNALSFLIDSYEKTSGVVDKIWLIQQENNSDIVDKFVTIRDAAEKLKVQEARAAIIAQYSGGLLVYADTVTVGTPKYQTFDDTTGFGAEQSAQSVGASAINWIRVAAAPTRDEWIIVTRDAANVIKAQVCTGVDGGVSCGTPTTISATAGTHGLRNFDVAYEMTSGDALLVYGNATVDALRKIEWNGSSWINDAAITTTRTSGTVEWVELTSRPASNQIGIAYSDTNDDVSAYRWDGTTAADEATAVITATAPTSDVRKFDVSFEGISGDMLVVSWVAALGTAVTGQLVGTTWTINTQAGVDQLSQFVDLQEPNPSDNDIAVSSHGAATATNPSEGWEWDGAAVNDGNAGDDVVQNWAANYQLSAVAYLNTTYYAVAVISNGTATDDIDWWTMNSAGSITDQTVNTRTRGASRFIDLFDYPNADKVLLLTSDANSDLWADTWNGATPSATVWTNLTSAAALETSLSIATKDVVDFSFRLAPPPATTTLSTGTNPGNSTIAPGGAITSVNGFTLTTNTGTDAITSITVNLSTNSGVGTLTITDGADAVLGSIGGGTGAGIVTGSNAISITSTNATTGGTAFKVKVTPLSHANMPVPDGGAYAITGVVTDWAGTNTKAGQANDTSDTVTIDNDSPAGTTGAGATSGENAQSTVSWTNPGDADFQQVYIYCKTSSMISGEAPTEGTDPAVDGTACDGTARMKYKGTASPQTITGLTNGTPYYFRIYGRDTNGNFTAYSATQEVSGTPSAPAATLTISASAGSKVATKNSGDVNQYAHDTACTGAATCAAFTLAAAGGAVSVSQIKITENGSVTANTELSDVNLYYDTNGNWADAEDETLNLFGTAASFAADQTATVSGTLNISSGQTAYIYVRYDLANGAVYPIGGATVNFQIAAAGDVVSDGTESGTGTLAGTQTVLPVADSVTYAVGGDGGRSGDTATISGKGFGAPSTDADQQDCATATVGTKGCVRFIVGGSDTVEGTDISTWNNTTIIFIVSATGLSATNGGTATLEVVAAAQSTATDLTYYIYPNITAIVVTTGNCTVPGGSSTTCPNANREGDNITLDGDHFGAAQGDGSITFQGGFSPSQVGSVSSWGATAVTLTIPTAIDNNDYTGDIRLLRDSAISAKDDIWTGFRILPKITSTSHATNPNLKGGRGDTGVSINGDHLCQTGTCPTAFSAADSALFAPDGVTANITAGASVWTDTSIPSITIPTDATDGSLAITSNTTYVSDFLTFDIKFAPTTPTNSSPTNGATGQSKNPTITADAFSDINDSPQDSHSDSQWQITRVSGDYAAGNKVWEDTLVTAQVTIAVNNTNGTFTNTTLSTELNCGTIYYWRVSYKDNGGVSSKEWSTPSPEFSFTTTACGPDATSLTNNTEGGLTDGARIGQVVTITGTGFGTPSALDTCTAGATNGCIKIGGTGGIIVTAANINCWNTGAGNCAGGTKISFTLPSAITNYGGATTSGAIVYFDGNTDANGLTFYVYPDITSLSVSEARETDTITINGNHFGTGTTGAAVTIVGAASTIPGDLVVDVSCDNVDGWAETCIKITITTAIADATDSGYVIITQGTGSNNKLTNSTDAQSSLGILPRIVSLTTPADAPDSVSAWQASSITVNGSHFGAYNATNSRVAVNGSTVDPGSGGWGVSAITLTVPAAATNNGVIQATRGDTKTSNNSATFYVLPKVTSTGPTSGEAREGDAITIAGNHFCGTGGTCTNLPTVRFYNASQTVDVTANSGATDASLGVSVSSTISDSINSFNLEVVRSAIGGQDDGKSSTNTTRNNFTYTILPDITDVSNPTAYPNAAREYSASDSDGIITVNGNHFGAAGTVTVLGCGATDCVGSGVTQVTTGTCTGSAYQAICVGIQIPNTSLSDSLYLGNIVLTRTADSKTDTYGANTFRILPRTLATSPVSGIVGAIIQITGNHFCQTGTCPVSPNRSSAADNVKFGTTQALDADFMNQTDGAGACNGLGAAWNHAELCVKVPVGTPAGSQPVTVRSNNFDSDTEAFTKQSSVPADPTNLYQFETNTDLDEPPASYDPLTETYPAGKVAVGGGINQTNAWLRATASAGVNATLLCIEVEAKTVATAFDGTGTVLATSAPGCQAFTVGTPVKLFVNVTSGLTDSNSYKWRARIKNDETSEYGGWVNASVDGQSKSFYIDTSAPSSLSPVCPTTTFTASTADISWTPLDVNNMSSTFTKQAQYDDNSDFSSSTCSPDATCGTPTGGLGANPQTTQLTGLTPSKVYYYRARSKDGAGNEKIEGYGISGNTTCTFTTSQANMRTAEYIITGETSAVTAETFKNFQVYITEQGYNVQNAFVEISGIAGTGGGASMTLGLRVDGANTVAYTNYTVAISDTVATPFTILHKVDTAVSGLYVAPSSSSNNKLYINPSSGDSVYIASAKIVVTYYYTP